MGEYFHYKSNRIYYTDQGKGIPLILLHGYLETSEIWLDFSRELTAKFRVLAVDLPGHGKSDVYGAIHTMEFMADVVRGLIDKLNISPVFLTGHSMGGYVAMAFADLFPCLLSGYCLFHSHPFSDQPETIEKRIQEIKLVEEGNKDKMLPGNISKLFATPNLQKLSDSVRQSLKIASDIPGEGIIAVLRGMMERPSRLAVMENGRVPCLWILGTMDNHINCELIQTKIRLPENAEVVILENSGHMGFIEEKERSLKVLEDFINKVN